MGKTKCKEDGLYFCSNNAVDVTGSMIYGRYRGKQFLLESGMVQNNDYLESYRANTEPYIFKPSEIDYVFIGHVHIDHCGMLPRLVKSGFSGKIIASHETALLLKPLLLNSCFILKSEASALSLKYKRSYSPIYEENDVMDTLNLVYEYDNMHEINVLDDVISFEWLENGHCVGARQLRIYLTDINGVKNPSILYTSDIGSLHNKNHFLPDTEIPDSFAKYTIMESTYGEPGRVNKKTREFDMEMLKTCIDTIMDREGSVLMPCFSFSRTQEILTNIYEIYHDTDFKFDVVVDSMLSCDICKLYNELLTGEDLELWKKVCSWKNVKFITEKDESLACVKAHAPKVVISSSGFCMSGRILSYLHEYLEDENSMVLFSGFTGTDNSYLSYRIKNQKENQYLKISGEKLANRIDCKGLSTMSSHANRKDLLEFGSSISTEKLILVHGSVVAKNSLKDDLQKEISKKNKTYKVIASTKDMFVRL